MESKKDKPCTCVGSFFAPHRKSRCSLNAKTGKKVPPESSIVSGGENKTVDESTSSNEETNDDKTTSTTDQMCSKSVVSEDNTKSLDGERGAHSSASDDDDNSTLVDIVLNSGITNLGKMIEEPDDNSAEQKELIAVWGNRRCDDCPVAARFPHRRIRCRFKYVANMVMTELDAARSLVNECADSNAPRPDESKASKQCTCFGSRFERHRKEKCFFKAVAQCQVTEAVAVSVNGSTSPKMADAVVVENDSGGLMLEMPTDGFSYCGILEQVYDSPNMDDAYDDNMSMISEDEFVEYVTVHNKTYTAEEVRAIFERMQDEINRLKKAQKEQNEADLPTQPSSMEATPVSPTSA